ncbi:unnamed protein product, partial [marine sediment metagenome]
AAMANLKRVPFIGKTRYQAMRDIAKHQKKCH